MENSVLFLKDLAKLFYAAIVEAKLEFSMRDRMSRFPRGCCDDASDLFGYYLLHEHNIHSFQCKGRYEDDNPENTTNHVWLLVEGIIIDLTYSQFFPEEKMYVGEINEFYQSLTDMCEYDNINIQNDQRLSNDYRIIMSHLAE